MKWIVFIFFTVTLSPKVVAFSVPRPMLPPPAASPNTAIEGVSGLETLLGHEMTEYDLAQIKDVAAQVETLREKPIMVSTGGGVSIHPMVCGYGKMSLSVSSFKGPGWEYQPCVEYEYIGFPRFIRVVRSHIMHGPSFIFGTSMLTVGLRVGAFVFPEADGRPAEGAYGYVELSGPLGPLAKMNVQVSFGPGCQQKFDQILAKQGWTHLPTIVGQCPQMFMVGIGADLSGFLFDLGKIVRGVARSPAGGATGFKGFLQSLSGGFGAYVSVKEHPWYDRLVNQGMSLSDAFADMKKD
ncbi:MAG: hypothetical protein AB7F86_03680 [Bdellovibrionales bacterium]